MTIGDPTSFAIQFEVFAPASPWLFGKIAYSVGASIVGDYEIGASLNVAYAGFMELLRFRGNRNDKALINAPKSDAFDVIDRALYTGPAGPCEEIAAELDAFNRFHAYPPGLDVFDFWKCFLVEDDVSGRFLWAGIGVTDGERGEVHEQLLAYGQFDSVIEGFIIHMREAYGVYLGAVAK